MIEYFFEYKYFDKPYRLGDTIVINQVENTITRIRKDEQGVTVRYEGHTTAVIAIEKLNQLVSHSVTTGWYHIKMNEPRARYNADCPACFGGMPHTQRQCNRNISRVRKASR